MNLKENEKRIVDYFDATLKKHGSTPKGVDWNSEIPQNLRFEQLLKVIHTTDKFSILDYGCGYGALLNYLQEHDYSFSKYVGYDISEMMINKARTIHAKRNAITFTTEFQQISKIDYTVASGVFNMKLETPNTTWTEYVLSCLNDINDKSKKGFAITFLTKYSDVEKMRADLYYADPCFLFDHSKRHYAKNVAILHDYGAYDFTLIIRKDIWK